MKRKKRYLKFAPWILVLAVLFWLSFIHTDRYGLTSWEHTRDAFGEDDWVGWIHPLGMDVNRAVTIGPFDSIEQCQNEAFERMQRSYNEWTSAQYFCGYRCTNDDHRDREENCRIVRK